MSEAKLSRPGEVPTELGYGFSERAGEPVMDFKPTPDFAPPVDYSDRIEWVRQSYERFIEKMLEIEALRGPSLAF